MYLILIIIIFYKSIFTNELVGDDLPGFKTFVVKFMIQMSHDFALPSLYISDRSALQMKSDNKAQFEIEQLKMRRKWENDPHPYLFFNPGKPLEKQEIKIKLKLYLGYVYIKY